MAKRKTQKSKFTTVVAIFLVLVLLALVAFGFYMYKYRNDDFMRIYNSLFHKEEKPPVVVDGDLSIHFLELGNEYAGDCVYIKAGDTDMLVDAGSRAGSVPTIKNYLDNYVTDGVLEYVVATHADQDHIAGFAASNGIFDLYECKTIIDFALTNKTTKTYQNYVSKREAEVESGAKHYTALQCYNETDGAKRTYALSEDVNMTILYQKFYENSSGDENNYSVCFMLTHGDRNFLFTGDLEEKGEESLVEENPDLPQVELFKAGHHGSKTSSNDVLLKKIKPKIVCVCCCAGSVEYTQNLANTFPTQAFINRVAEYTDKVYVTTAAEIIFDEVDNEYKTSGFCSLNGNIVVSSGKEGVSVNCSDNNTLLKDSDWFKNYVAAYAQEFGRECPIEWRAA